MRGRRSVASGGLTGSGTRGRGRWLGTQVGEIWRDPRALETVAAEKRRQVGGPWVDRGARSWGRSRRESVLRGVVASAPPGRVAVRLSETGNSAGLSLHPPSVSHC